MNKLLRSPPGFSLVELMIALVVVGMVMAGFAQLMSNMQKGQKSMQLASDINSTETLVSLLMSNDTTCTANMNTTNLSTTTFNTAALPSVSITVNKITYPGGAVALQSGASAGNGLTVNSMTLHGFQQLTAGTAYQAMLTVVFGKVGGLGSATSSKDIPIGLTTVITTAPTAQIVACSSSGGNGVPAGAVVAFDVPCPTGWSLYTLAHGRVIIGTGYSGAPYATAHSLGQQGGEEMHQLSVAEMPSHNHEVGFSQYVYGLTTGYIAVVSDHGDIHSSYSGGNQPHNIMQPFVALHYCRKN